MKRILAIVLALTMVLSLAACKDNDSDKPTSSLENNEVELDQYSIGLDENGFYENFDQYEINAVNVQELQVDVEEVLKYIASGGEDVEVSAEDIDAYVYEYANNVLVSLGLAARDVVEDKYYVDCTMEFYIDGDKLEDMGTSEAQTYQANSTGDTIMQSLIGHKVNDEYEVEYVFPEEDTSYAGKTATVKVKITAINDNNPLAAGVIEKNVEALKEYFNEADTTENFLKEIRPLIAYTHLLDYFTYYFQTYEGIEAPEKLVEDELYRFNCRLKSFGYTMTDYLEAASVTEEEIVDYCKSLVIENLLLMSVYQQSGEEPVTDDELKTMYEEEDYEYTVSMLGIPYMKLDIMREIALNYTALNASLMFNGEKYIPDDKYFVQVEIDGENTENAEGTETTEDTTPTEDATGSTEENVDSSEETTAE